jgi:hypothetical protein
MEQSKLNFAFAISGWILYTSHEKVDSTLKTTGLQIHGFNFFFPNGESVLSTAMIPISSSIHPGHKALN